MDRPFPRRRRILLLALIALPLAIWLHFRSTPLARAQRALASGEASDAIVALTAALERPSPRREEALRELLIEAYLKKGALEDADRECRRLLEMFPNNFTASLGLGVLNLANERLGFSVDYLDRAHRLSPNDPRPLFLLLSARLAQGAQDKAREVLEEGLRTFPDRVEFIESAGDLAFDGGQYQSALQRYNEVLRRFPTDQEALRKRARAHLSSGDLDAAEADLEELRRKSFDPSIEFVQMALLAQRGLRDEAERLAVRIFSEDRGLFQAGLAVAFWRGRRGDTSGADSLLSDIAHRLPPLRPSSEGASPATWENLESIHRRREAARAVHRDYEIARAHWNLHRGRLPDAVVHAHRALDLDGASPAARLLLADLARRRGDREERWRWIERTTSLYRDHPAALLARGWASLDIGRTSDAVVDAKTVADLYPKLSSAQSLLARVSLLAGRGAEAVETARRAVALNDGDPDAHLALALARAATGDAAGAESSFLRAIALDPYWADGHARYSSFLARAGRDREALRHRSEAKRLEPMTLFDSRPGHAR